jgi:hypothetical protein
MPAPVIPVTDVRLIVPVVAVVTPDAFATVAVPVVRLLLCAIAPVPLVWPAAIVMLPDAVPLVVEAAVVIAFDKVMFASLEIVSEPLPAKVIVPGVKVPVDSLSYSMAPAPPAVMTSVIASASVDE